MLEWLTEALDSSLSPVVFPAAFLLGFLGSVTSCCNLPLFGAIAGYSGTLVEGGNRRALLRGALFFMLGTISAFAALGAVSGLIGQVAGASLGFYWKLIAGFIMVLFGLANLNLLPFALTEYKFAEKTLNKPACGSMLHGFALGGAAAACSACCNPVLPVVLAVTTLQGHILWGAAMLTAFSVGYGLPMTGGIVGLGFGFGNLASVVQKINPLIKTVSGLLLIIVGFYMLATA